MRLPKLDLRLRIAVVLATVCIAVVGALGITLYLASEDMEKALVEQLVTEELESLIERARLSGGQAPAGGPNRQYYVLSASEHYERLPAALRNLGPGHHQVGEGFEEQHVAVRDVNGTRYMVVYDESLHEAREARFRGLIYSSVGTAAIIAAILGYWLAGVLTHQLTELASRVTAMAPDEPHAPLERADHDREVASLAPSLDAYHARVLETMAREQEFTAMQVDRKALQLVLANLIKNAVRYTERGFVRVSFKARRLTVSDSGAGITPEHLPQLFERYYRAGSKPDGLGLGLAIVRRVCNDFGWKIEVQSTPGAGSAFSVVFA